MSRTTNLKYFLKRGALIAAANWQVVIVQFVADAVFKTMLAVPVVGGVFLVVLVVGGDPSDLLELDSRQVIPATASVLMAHPVALAAFLVSLAVVVAGGSLLLFLVKGGTVTVLIAADRVAGAIEHRPLRMSSLARAAQFSLERFTSGSRSLFRRYVRLGLWLAAVYAISVGLYLAVVFGPPGDTEVWTLVAALASVVLLAWITIVNSVYLLFQIVMAVDDCGVRAAAGRVLRLLGGESINVSLIFGSILVLVVLATAASILATAALGLIAFVPFVGLAALPLQLLAWVLRGLVFQFVGLAALVAYLRVYRVSRDPAAADVVEGSNESQLHRIGRTA
jgi:hypothetical protein